MQIPNGYWPSHLKERALSLRADSSEDSIKGQFKVMVHQLAFRSTGKLLPEYSDGVDIVHTCGNGRRKSIRTRPQEAAGVPCIEPSHLAIASHKVNMEAQKCRSLVKCEHCGLLSRVCKHVPMCKAGRELEGQYESTCNEKVVEITIKYKSGRTVKVSTKDLEIESSSHDSDFV